MLLDTSAVLWFLKKGEDIRKHFILDLTLYEVGNVLWKRKMGGEVLELVSKARIIYPGQEDLLGIFNIAKSERLTFYDASYVYFASKYGFILATADRELSKVARKYVEVLDVPSV